MKIGDGWDPREDAWLSGFTDGEGSFIISRDVRKQYVHPRFAITLRADDAAVLRALREAFGGSLSYGRAYGNDSPKFGWHVVGKRDLAVLIKYFDRFPLRAKKARDYAIWREAVAIYVASHGSGRDPRLTYLRDALIAGRAFSAPEDDQPDPALPFAVQTALGID